MKGKGKGRDSWTNGLFMPSTSADARQANLEWYHNGSHSRYGKGVDNRIKAIRKEYQSDLKKGMDPDMAKCKASSSVAALQDNLRNQFSQALSGKVPRRLF